MELDLAAAEFAEVPTAPVRAQVCIIGAGIAGLTLAHRLVQQGIDIVLLEAGGSILSASDPYAGPFTAAHLTGEPHQGTVEGRCRVFGGTSLRWGGQLLPMPSGSAWPIAAAELARHTAAAEAMLGVDTLPYAAAEFFASSRLHTPSLLSQLPELEVSLSKWVPFLRRNLAKTLGREVAESAHARVYLHAQVTELLLAPARTHLDAALVLLPSGAVLRVEATHFVLAAGTVETSRLLLASRSVALEGVGNAHGQVGRNFHDHLTLPVAEVRGPARERLLRELRPWAIDGTLRTPKLQASHKLCERLAITPVLAHLTLEEPEDSGFAVVRELFHARQLGGLGAALRRHALQLPGAALDAARLAWSARFRHRRYVSAGTAVRLNLSSVQPSPTLSRITLAPDVDGLGVPQAIVDWHVTAAETETLRTFACYLRERFAALNLAGLDWLPELSQPDAGIPGARLPGILDARHAMGGACMGRDPRSSVVDPDLAVHGVANLSIAGAAVFPDGAPPLPTLPLMALALRLADSLTARLASAAPH